MENNGKLDLDEFARRLKLRVDIATDDKNPEEEEFQRRQKESDAHLQRVKDAVVFGVAITLIVAVSTICILIALGKEFSADDKRWATSILTLVIGGVVGYVTGKAAK